MHELVIRLAKAAGWEVGFETESRAWGVGRSIDVRLVDRSRRLIVIVECWNTYGNLGEAARSSNAKLARAEEWAVAIAGVGEPYEVGLVWVVRDSIGNRELVARYRHIFDARFAGSSVALRAALMGTGSMPADAGMVWCDVRATRLFAPRRGSVAR